MTPEGKVKKQVKALLDGYDRVHTFMPVPSGFGRQGVDFHCGVAGYALYIETKAPGGDLSPRQREFCWNVAAAGNAVFIVSDSGGLKALEGWLSTHTTRKVRVR